MTKSLEWRPRYKYRPSAVVFSGWRCLLQKLKGFPKDGSSGMGLEACIGEHQELAAVDRGPGALQPEVRWGWVLRPLSQPLVYSTGPV